MTEETKSIDQSTELGQEQGQEQEQAQKQDSSPDFTKQFEDFTQKFKSEQGRMWKELKDAKQVNERLMDLLSNSRESSYYEDDYTPEKTERQRFNDHLKEMIQDGNIVEAFGLYQSAQKKATANLNRLNQDRFEKAMDSLNGPYAKELKDVVEKEAIKLMSNGKSPESAVALAFSEAKNAALLGMIQQRDSAAFEMLTSGKTPPKDTSSGKFPGGLEKSFQDGLKKGTWKDRKEYISYLSPQVKAAYNLE